MLTRIVTAIVSLSVGAIQAAVVYTGQAYPFYPSNEVRINLDGVAGDDLLIDLGITFVGMRDAPYTIVPLGGAALAATGGIASSFHVGDFIELASLAFISNPDSAFAGGTVTDALGNPVSEGWGVDFDSGGYPTGPPDHFIDLFLVDLPSGVAWVDLSVYTALGELPVRWGYLDTDSSSFQITGIPEPSMFLLVGVGLGSLALLRRRIPNKSCLLTGHKPLNFTSFST